MDTQVLVYTTTHCSDCRRTKKWLEEKKITYKEINIEHDERALSYVLKVNNGMSVSPTVVFPDGTILAEPTNRQLAEEIERQKLFLSKTL